MQSSLSNLKSKSVHHSHDAEKKTQEKKIQREIKKMNRQTDRQRRNEMHARKTCISDLPFKFFFLHWLMIFSLISFDF